MLEVIIKAFFCGFVASIPVGPTGIFVMQRSLTKGSRGGIVAGAGSAFADTIYAAFALSALTIVQTFVSDNSRIINLVGGTIVLLMGLWMTCRNPFRKTKPTGNLPASPKDLLNSLLLALTNPGAIVAMFGVLSIFRVESTTLLSFILTLLFIFAGALTYWSVISFFFSKLRGHVKVRTLVWINRVMGTIVALLGIGLILSGLTNNSISL